MSSFQILSAPESNAKLQKALRLGYCTVGLSLAPAKMSGYNVCPHATSCADSCVGGETVGLAQVYPDTILGGRIRKTRELFQNRDNFLETLRDDVRRAARRAQKLRKILALRLNVFSDLPWRDIRHSQGWSIFNVIFQLQGDYVVYDYTKDWKRAVRELDSVCNVRWNTVFSRSERNEAQCLEYLRMGGRVAVAFDCAKGELPDFWRGYRVVDGDGHDLTFLQPTGTVIGLAAKGSNTEGSEFFARPELSFRVLSGGFV